MTLKDAFLISCNRDPNEDNVCKGYKFVTGEETLHVQLASHLLDFVDVQRNKFYFAYEEVMEVTRSTKTGKIVAYTAGIKEDLIIGDQLYEALEITNNRDPQFIPVDQVYIGYKFSVMDITDQLKGFYIVEYPEGIQTFDYIHHEVYSVSYYSDGRHCCKSTRKKMRLI